MVGASGVVANKYNATSTTATSTFAGNLYVAGNTVLDNVQVGPLLFETNAGTVTWIDLPVTASAPNNTEESYTASINGTNLLTVYSQSDGSGGIKNPRIGVGTTTPFGLLSVEQSTETASLWIGNSGSSTPSLMVNGVNGTAM